MLLNSKIEIRCWNVQDPKRSKVLYSRFFDPSENIQIQDPHGHIQFYTYEEEVDKYEADRLNRVFSLLDNDTTLPAFFCLQEVSLPWLRTEYRNRRSGAAPLRIPHLFAFYALEELLDAIQVDALPTSYSSIPIILTSQEWAIGDVKMFDLKEEIMSSGDVNRRKHARGEQQLEQSDLFRSAFVALVSQGAILAPPLALRVTLQHPQQAKPLVIWSIQFSTEDRPYPAIQRLRVQALIESCTRNLTQDEVYSALELDRALVCFENFKRQYLEEFVVSRTPENAGLAVSVPLCRRLMRREQETWAQYERVFHEILEPYYTVRLKAIAAWHLKYPKRGRRGGGGGKSGIERPTEQDISMEMNGGVLPIAVDGSLPILPLSGWSRELSKEWQASKKRRDESQDFLSETRKWNEIQLSSFVYINQENEKPTWITGPPAPLGSPYRWSIRGSVTDRSFRPLRWKRSQEETLMSARISGSCIRDVTPPPVPPAIMHEASSVSVREHGEGVKESSIEQGDTIPPRLALSYGTGYADQYSSFSDVHGFWIRETTKIYDNPTRLDPVKHKNFVLNDISFVFKRTRIVSLDMLGNNVDLASLQLPFTIRKETLQTYFEVKREEMEEEEEKERAKEKKKLSRPEEEEEEEKESEWLLKKKQQEKEKRLNIQAEKAMFETAVAELQKERKENKKEEEKRRRRSGLNLLFGAKRKRPGSDPTLPTPVDLLTFMSKSRREHRQDDLRKRMEKEGASDSGLLPPISAIQKRMQDIERRKQAEKDKRKATASRVEEIEQKIGIGVDNQFTLLGRDAQPSLHYRVKEPNDYYCSKAMIQSVELVLNFYNPVTGDLVPLGEEDYPTSVTFQGLIDRP